MHPPYPPPFFDSKNQAPRSNSQTNSSGGLGGILGGVTDTVGNTVGGVTVRFFPSFPPGLGHADASTVY